MALKEVFARLSVVFDGQGKLDQGNKAVDKFAKRAEDGASSLAGLGAGLIGAFAGNALLGGLNHFAEQLDVLDDLHAQTNIATDALQVYGYAAEVSGVRTEEFNASLSLLQKSLGKTTEASGAQVEALNKLKIDTSKPRELADVLPEIFDGFGKLASANEKAAVATSLFGRAGVRLIPTLERGQDGIAALRKELEESGGIVDAQTIARAGEYRDNLARLDRSMFALKGTIAGALFPQLSKVAEGISKAVGFVSNFTKGTTLADNAGVALAATLAGPVFGALRPFIGKGLKFAAIFFAVDEVIGFLNGKQSLLADALDGVFGAGSSGKVRDWANDAIGSFQMFVGSGQAAFDALGNSNASFGTRALAGIALMTAHFTDSFAAIFEGWSSIMNGMTLAIEQFVLGAMQKWNGLLDVLVLPDIVKKALQIDTTDQEQKIVDTKKREDVRDMRAYARQSGTGEFEFTAEGQRARAAYASSLPGEIGAPQETRTQRINREMETAKVEAVGLAPAQVTGTLATAAVQGTTAILNDNKTVNLTFGNNTTAADKDAIKKAVAEALRTDNRAALEALTQKAK